MFSLKYNIVEHRLLAETTAIKSFATYKYWRISN